MNAVTRPPKWDSDKPPEDRAPEAAWEAVPDTGWRIEEGRKCRFGSPKAGYCRRPSVAALNRGPQWWAYCERHMYRRWVEDGQVLIWRIKRDWWRRRGDGAWEFRDPSAVPA